MKFKFFLYRLLKISVCKQCSSTKLNDGCWIRGWDNIYGGAVGSRGIRCYDCGNVVFEESKEDYKKSHHKDRFEVFR